MKKRVALFAALAAAVLAGGFGVLADDNDMSIDANVPAVITPNFTVTIPSSLTVAYADSSYQPIEISAENINAGLRVNVDIRENQDLGVNTSGLTLFNEDDENFQIHYQLFKDVERPNGRPAGSNDPSDPGDPNDRGNQSELGTWDNIDNYVTGFDADGSYTFYLQINGGEWFNAASQKDGDYKGTLTFNISAEIVGTN